MSVSLSPLFNGWQGFSIAGLPLAGGLLNTYVAGTSTPALTYTDNTGGTPNANPIQLDAAGLPPSEIWLTDGVAYKFILTDALALNARTFDNITGVGSGSTNLAALLASTASSSTGTGMLGWLRAAASAVATTLYRYLNWQDVNVFEFMTVAQIADVQARTALIDVGAAVRAAVAAAIAQNKTRVYMPAGSYLITSTTAGADAFGNGILFPFSAVNPDPATGMTLCGAGSQTVLLCGSNNMIMLRVSRNNVTVRDMTLDGNGKTTVWGRGVVPEDMTQTTTTVSQQFITFENVGTQNFTEGTVLMPGPQVAGSDSGCFYMRFVGGFHNLNTRHFYSRKNVDWATHPNRATRITLFQHNHLRGNTGLHLEVGSEFDVISCFDELIATGATPNATPTARHISADCTNIRFVSGYSEACTKSVSLFANNLSSWGYIPASGSTTDWRTYASAYEDGIDDSSSWTPVLASSGGGAQGAVTSTGKLTKLGKTVNFTCQVSAAKGTLGAGTLTVSGLPFIADSTWAGAAFQGISVTNWSGITFTTNVFTMGAFVSGATLTLRKLHAAGGVPAGLTLAECADPVVFTIQGFYKAV